MARGDPTFVRVGAGSGSSNVFEPHRTAPHRTAPHRTSEETMTNSPLELPGSSDPDSVTAARPSAPGLDGRTRSTPPAGPVADMIAAWEGTAQHPLTGITSGGAAEEALFRLQRTGASTHRLIESAADLLASLDPVERTEVLQPLGSRNWRRWSNFAPNLMRHGALLEDLTDDQRDRALGVLRATLSATGFAAARDIMRLNHTLAELTGHWSDYGEWLYWISVFGEPSADRPWGWQVDGHHLIVNTFVLGDQMVTTPMFFGSEPVAADAGAYAGTFVLQEEERQGYELLQSLTPAQRAVAVLGGDPPPEVFTGSFRDNFELRYDGIASSDLTADQQARLRRLVEVYVGRTRPEHAAVTMGEIDQHLDRTYFAWSGQTGPGAAFYYRIHSPVVLIEFDHLPGVAFLNRFPTRRHIHTVVGTPNGNDYGADLLRQHYEQTHFDPRHTHQ